jgi:hypothetical protein
MVAGRWPGYEYQGMSYQGMRYRRDDGERGSGKKQNKKHSLAKQTQPPVGKKKHRSVDRRTARPVRTRAPCALSLLHETERASTYRKRRVFSRPKRAEHRAELACGWVGRSMGGFRVSGETAKGALGGGFRRANSAVYVLRVKTSPARDLAS